MSDKDPFRHPIALETQPVVMNQKRSRLRAATSMSSPVHNHSHHHHHHHHYRHNYCSPSSCMAIRRTGRGRGGENGGGSLAAIAGPMGIKILDMSPPKLRPLLTLDYSSFGSGGITAMAFQPCLSTLEQKQCTDLSAGERVGTSNNNNNSILLATARGCGILIWDCSGRVLSPLLGRLNASNDAWTADATKRNEADGGTIKVAGRSAGISYQQQEQYHPYRQTQTLAVVETSTTTASTFSAEDAPMVTTRVRGSDYYYAMTAPSPLSNTTSVGKKKNNNVTSLEWKGPSAPILLSTCGDYACVWDLRTSVFSGSGASMGGGSGGARPNARYHHTAGSSSASPMLVDCAYCLDESKHVFATLDSMGRLRVWDDRKADNPIDSFLACPGGGVGIASVPPPCSTGVVFRWVTWGMDSDCGHTVADDLVVKVWSWSDSGSNDASSAVVTSRISMAGGLAARVHPSFADEVLLFRGKISTSEKDELLTSVSGLATTPIFAASSVRGDMNGEGTLVELLENSDATDLDVEMSAMSRPSSPATLLLEKEDLTREVGFSDRGWEAELWCICPEVSLSTDAIKETECRVEKSDNAHKIVALGGEGSGKDSISLAPGRGGDAGDVIAVDLLLGASTDTKADELSVCLLTEAGQFTVYSVIEASKPKMKVNPGNKSHITQTTSSIYCKVTTNCDAGIEWWKHNEEDDLALDGPMTIAVDAPPQNDLMLDDATSSSITNDVCQHPTMQTTVEIREVDLFGTMEDLEYNPVDAKVASRVPCPPICGVAFSRVGGLVMFSNGPVKLRWRYYQSSKSVSQSNSQIMVKSGNRIVSSVECDKDDDIRFSVFPKTLVELIDMLRSQTLQWGDGDNLQLDDNDAPGEYGGNSSCESSSYEDGDLLTLESDRSIRIHESEGSECSADNFSSSHQSCTDQNVASREFVGLPSLPPSVAITNKYRDILLSNQMPQLANLLMSDDKISNVTYGDKREIRVRSKKSSSSEVFTQSFDELPTHSSRLLPPQRTIMGNLKKLFANQLPTAMAPPDQTLFINNNRQNGTTQLNPEVRDSSDAQRSNKYIIPSQIFETASKHLEVSLTLCLHNSEVCSELGQKSKANTWTLLAQIVHSVISLEVEELNGWVGDWNALTTGVVEHILRYYEVQGDFQMLSTIVSVLNLGREIHFPGSTRFDERRCDNYLHQYAALLYGWGFFDKHSEISKRLIYPSPSFGRDEDTGSGKHVPSPNTAEVVLLPNTAEMMGITYTPVCVISKGPVQRGTKSSEYTFHCSICCHVVYGICTWCLCCGHGGHLDHMTEWFQCNMICPTGCGCVCLNNAVQ